MTRIGVLSDTHGYLDPRVKEHFRDVDEIWHAGDIGSYEVLQTLREFKPTRAVFGNMDGGDVRYSLSEFYRFRVEDINVLMTHIGGWPGHYPYELRRSLELAKPDIFVCGHSHILKVMYDKDYNLLHINPGAAGRQGFHKVGTLVRFTIDGVPKDLEILDFPKLV